MFKKVISVFMLLFICIFFNTFFVNAAQTSVVLQIDNSVMTVNDEEKAVDEGYDTKPIIVDGRTLLPVRAVIENLGGNVNWNNDTKEVNITYNENEIVLTINSTQALLNGKVQTLDTAPVIINSRTMLPIRFIAESLGFNIEWNENNKTIIITKNDTSENTESTTEIASEQITESENIKDETPEPENDSNILVAYFSATNNTKGVAEKIASELNADLFEIIPKEPYSDEDLNYSDNSTRATKEQNDENARPEISNVIENINDYNIIFLGYPIWWGQAPKIMSTFVESYDLSGKTIIPFCTSGSSAIGSSAKNLEKLNTASWLDGKRFSGGASSEEISQWLKSIENNIK